MSLDQCPDAEVEESKKYTQHVSYNIISYARPPSGPQVIKSSDQSETILAFYSFLVLVSHRL